MDTELDIELGFPAPLVWGVLSDFGNLSWYSSTAKRVECDGRGIGMRRTMHMVNGEVRVQRLEFIDHGSMSMRYSTDLPDDGPISDLVHALRVVPDGSNRCRIVTHLHFRSPTVFAEQDIKAFLETAISMAIHHLENHLKKLAQSNSKADPDTDNK